MMIVLNHIRYLIKNLSLELWKKIVLNHIKYLIKNP